MCKKMTWRLSKIAVCLLFVLAAVLCFGAFTVNAEETAPVSEPAVIASGSCGNNLTWVLTDDGKLTISGSGFMSGYPSAGNAPWYSHRDLIKSVEIGEGVTSIGKYAFYGCANMTSVVIPDSITSVYYGAFDSCKALTGVYISDLAAWYSINFEYANSNPLYFAKSLYLNDQLVTDLVIPDGVTSIGKYAFYNCSALTSVTIPDSVTTIGNYAFSQCTGLTGVYISDIAAWCSIDFVQSCNPLEYAKKLYLNDQLVTDLVIPDGVTSIGEEAFYCCEGLTSVVIPDGVTSIGVSAFNRCSNLASVVMPNSVTNIGVVAFAQCTGLKSIELSNGITSIGSSVFSGCTGLTSVVIPDSVTSIGSSAFNNCTGLKSIELSNSITSIGSSAFNNCTGLTGVVIPDSVTSMGERVFYNCIGLKSAVIPASMTSIADYTFYSCDNLTSIEIPNTVTSIGQNAFYSCDKLTEIIIPSSVTSIGKSVFGYCTGLTSVVIPDSVKSIGDEAFQDCHYLTSVVIGANVTSIGKSAFNRCPRLTSATFEDPDGWWYASSASATSGTEISTSDLSDTAKAAEILRSDYSYYMKRSHKHKYQAVVVEPTCSEQGYNTLTCECGESYIGNYVEPTGIHDIQDGFCAYCGVPCGAFGENMFWAISNGVLTIRGNGFMDDFAKGGTPWNDYLGEIVTVIVGEGVNYIGEYSFSGCKDLTKVELPSTLLSIGGNAFSGAYDLTTVVLPAKLISLGVKAFHGSGLTFAIFENTAGWYAGGAAVDVTDATATATYLKLAYSSVAWARDMSAAGDGNEIDGGSFNWSIDDNGTLTMTGKGEMPTYPTGKAPWSKYKSIIVKVVIGEGITSVSNTAFYEFPYICEVSLPETLTVIGDYAFYSCGSIARIEIPANVEYIGKYAFRRCGASEIVFKAIDGKSEGVGLWSCGGKLIGAGELTPGGAAQYLSKGYYKETWVLDKAQSWTAPEGGDVIIANGLYGAVEHTDAKWKLTADGTLVIFGNGAIKDSTSDGAPWAAYKDMITSVVIEEGITGIGKNAFSEHRAIVSVSLPSTLKRIEQYAFYNCTGVTELTVPASVEYIGAYALRKAGLTALVFEDAQGWKYNGNAVDKEIVGDASAMAELLKKVDYAKAWTKED